MNSINKKIKIISYKHDGSFHRLWNSADLIFNDKNLLILHTDNIEVTDSNGRKWKTREPAICYFYKQYWFNIICMMKKNGIHYYCNLSSPYVLDDEGVKYIDYELDIKVYPNGKMLELDKDEYDYNKIQMAYSDKILNIINKNMEILESRIKNKTEPFDKISVSNWYNTYKERSTSE